MLEKLRFLVRSTYAHDDKTFSGDAYNVELIDLDTDEVVTCGDYYHHKIYDKIEGFFEALDYLNVPYEKSEENVNEESEEGA